MDSGVVLIGVVSWHDPIAFQPLVEVGFFDLGLRVEGLHTDNRVATVENGCENQASNKERDPYQVSSSCTTRGDSKYGRLAVHCGQARSDKSITPCKSSREAPPADCTDIPCIT